MRFKNLTKHPINIFVGNKKITIQPCGSVARCDEITEVLETPVDYDGEIIPVVRRKFMGVPNLPPKEEGCLCIVSWNILSRVPDRDDLVSPDTGDNSVVRDDNGFILGVKRLQRF